MPRAPLSNICSLSSVSGRCYCPPLIGVACDVTRTMLVTAKQTYVAQYLLCRPKSPPDSSTWRQKCRRNCAWLRHDPQNCSQKADEVAAEPPFYSQDFPRCPLRTIDATNVGLSQIAHTAPEAFSAWPILIRVRAAANRLSINQYFTASSLCHT